MARMKRTKGKKAWGNMGGDERRAEFLRRLPVVSRALRGMEFDSKRQIVAAAALSDDDNRFARHVMRNEML